MNSYITAKTIKNLRERAGFTQSQLAEKLSVSNKAVSKWETGRGYPDISLIKELASVLSVSVNELLSGNTAENKNASANMKKTLFYVCPVCGNIITSTGEASVSCHGIDLPPILPDECDGNHSINVETIEDEYYVTLSHEMSKEHYISFIAGLSDNGVEIIKLYPEGASEARIKKGRTEAIFAFCNRHGLFKIKI